jgi:hypothetical protein
MRPARLTAPPAARLQTSLWQVAVRPLPQHGVAAVAAGAGRCGGRERQIEHDRLGHRAAQIESVAELTPRLTPPQPLAC